MSSRAELFLGIIAVSTLITAMVQVGVLVAAGLLARRLQQTLERAWQRIQRLTSSRGKGQVVLRPKQETLMELLRVHGSLSPREIWDGIGISRQGAMDLLHPLMKAGMIKRIGTIRNGRYLLK